MICASLLTVILMNVLGATSPVLSTVPVSAVTAGAVPIGDVSDPLSPNAFPWQMLMSRPVAQPRKIGFLTGQDAQEDGGALTILPLFGSPAPLRRHRWNYHTVTDSRQAESMVQLPVEFKERRCTDEVACEEAYDGDVVHVHGRGPFKITMYD